MGINSTEVAYAFGQLGSAYTTASSDAIKPPTNKVFVAITMLEDTVFDSTTGLISTEPTKYINTSTTIANDLADGSETTDGGSGGKTVDSVSFPEGITIFGRWNEIDVNTGSIVAYIGD